ncbi:MAG: hypothetical protein JF619_06710 [Massilia sp.]|nr:hypothetical protein [Massilia sp.]
MEWNTANVTVDAINSAASARHGTARPRCRSKPANMSAGAPRNSRFATSTDSTSGIRPRPANNSNAPIASTLAHVHARTPATPLRVSERNTISMIADNATVTKRKSMAIKAEPANGLTVQIRQSIARYPAEAREIARRK